MRDFATLTHLTSYSTTLTQIGDLAFSIIDNGLRKTFSAPRKVQLEDLGIQAGSFEEINEAGMRKAINLFMKWSGFKAMDKFGKTTYINSTFANLQSMSDTKLTKELQHWFDTQEEIEALRKNIRDGKVTEEVLHLLYMKLADIQPLTRSQMPKTYLDSPGGRLFYTFKSFAIKQFDYLLQKNISNYKNATT